MLHELGFGGMLFSPMVVFVSIALVLTFISGLVMDQLDLRRLIWREAWFDVGLFVCYLALAVYLFGSWI
ncbi:DUF1656 domain-containing protein [Microbulbifer halophilus]|uniref:DUF1656 domain-containing protein n=1 Tax=Microbulbifer halophilus TaxID=453963 RepID=A0ABW5EB17_9GAMM|nr:DUF1656 domain-containing protein [Microbulbifer halophilus]MCW8128080.1 DUF1656 domain-containing protein [Microbulbifer halophilus]